MAEVNQSPKGGIDPQSPSKKTTERERVNNIFLNQYRGDAVVVPIKLVSTEINRAYRKHFDGVSRSLFYVRYYSRALNNTIIEQEVLTGVITLLDQAAEGIRHKNEIADNLIGQYSVKIKNGVAQTTINASVIDPLANRYLKLVAAADEVARKYRALWMALAIDDKQKNQAMNETVNVLRQVHTNSARISLGLRDRVSSRQNSKLDDAGINEAAMTGNDEFQDEFETEGAGV
ncbi:MAG: hypothetical protein PHU14_10175 [Methylovulum sp.]|nr:hypothetical protein [Methylovulum sp.]